MNVLAAALVPENALPDLFPKVQIITKLILLPASIVEHVQIHVLPVLFQHNGIIHKERVQNFDVTSISALSFYLIQIFIALILSVLHAIQHIL
jgi:hypothetical protein